MSGRLSPDQSFQMFTQILDGVEAAHLQGAVHRDLKPENVLVDQTTDTVAIADFGIAQFTEDILFTLVETRAEQRLANFQYAAPEQKERGANVGKPADIFALGLMLSELFTGVVPNGTQYKQIGDVSPGYKFLDAIVAAALRQNPSERPGTIAELKGMIQKYHAGAVTLQRLSDITKTVVPEDTVDDPLAIEPPRLIGAELINGTLHLTMDRSVSHQWIQAMLRTGNFSSVMGAGPGLFSFAGEKASVRVPEQSAQDAINHFKEWLPKATQTLKVTLEHEAALNRTKLLEHLRREREAEEKRLRVNQSLKI